MDRVSSSRVRTILERFGGNGVFRCNHCRADDGLESVYISLVLIVISFFLEADQRTSCLTSGVKINEKHVNT